MIVGSGRPRTGRPKRGSYREGRDRKICIRIGEEDLKRLEKVSGYFQMTKSDYLIMCIREGFGEMNGKT